MQKIDRSTVDRIYDAVRVEEIVGDYVSLKRRGTNMLGLCPFHDEKTPSFMVSPAKGIYKCFGCGKGGNAINFIMEVEQLSYYDALKQAADKYHIHIEERVLSSEEQKQFNDRDSMMMLNEFSRKYFTEQLLQTADGRAIGLSYFKQRGFTDQIIEKFQLGYGPEGKDVFVRAAIDKGYKEEYLAKTGLATIKPEYKRDRFSGRVIFPIHGQSGKVVAFAGRTLSSDKKIAKYINSPESELYHKSDVLYGIYHAKKEIQRKDNCFLVEGYTDVMSLHQSGIENVVASSGTSLTQGQIRLIQRFTENVTVIYDGDNAGIKASLRGIDLILAQGLNVRVLLLPDGEDPDSFAKSMGASELMDYIEKNRTDFIHFKANLLMDGVQNDPMKMAHLIQEIVGSIAVIPNEIKRTVYIKASSALLDVPEDTLYRECNKLINKEKVNRNKEAERVLNRQRFEQHHKPDPAFDHPPDDLGMPDDLGPAPASVVAQMAAPKASVAPQLLEERMVMVFLLRYGEMLMFKEDDEYYEDYADLTVADFLLDHMEEDELVMENPIFNAIIKEYSDLKAQGKTQLERHFIHHENQTFSQIAVDLTTERHERSKLFEGAGFIESNEERLGILVPKIYAELQLYWVQKEIQKINEIFKNEKDEAKLDEAMTNYQELNIFKSELSKLLGNRTILGS